MPGVRVRVSSRGVRTSVGPRIARVHVGAGSPGFSTGLGPISYGTSLGGSGGRSSGSYGSGSYYSSYGPTPTQVAKAQEAQWIQQRIDALTKAHQQSFPSATREIASLDKVESIEVIEKRIKATYLKGLSLFARQARTEAKERAHADALVQHAQLVANAEFKMKNEQAAFDRTWQKLNSNDSDTVARVVTLAYGDNEAKAAVIDIEEDLMTVFMMAPPLSVIPERNWSYTAAGNLSVKKMTAGDRNDIYFDLIPSQAVATAKEGFASAPGITKIRLLVMRNKSREGLPVKLECLGYGDIYREKLAKASAPTPLSILNESSDGWTGDLDNKMMWKPLNLAAEPELLAVIGEVEEMTNDPKHKHPADLPVEQSGQEANTEQESNLNSVPESVATQGPEPAQPLKADQTTAEEELQAFAVIQKASEELEAAEHAVATGGGPSAGTEASEKTKDPTHIASTKPTKDSVERVNLWDFKGRTSTRGYLKFLGVTAGLSIALLFMDNIPVLPQIIIVVYLISAFALVRRRLRDAGLSPWILLFAIVPLLGLIPISVAASFPTKTDGIRDKASKAALPTFGITILSMLALLLLSIAIGFLTRAK